MSERMIWPNWCGANITASGLKSESRLSVFILSHEMVIVPRTVGALGIALLAGGVADQIQGKTCELKQVSNTGPCGTKLSDVPNKNQHQ